MDFTGGSTHGVAKQVAAVTYSGASGVLPILGTNEWCWVIEDTSPGGSAYWSVPTGRSVKYYAGGTTVTVVTAGNNVNVAANSMAWKLYGPTSGGSTVMTLLL